MGEHDDAAGRQEDEPAARAATRRPGAARRTAVALSLLALGALVGATTSMVVSDPSPAPEVQVAGTSVTAPEPDSGTGTDAGGGTRTSGVAGHGDHGAVDVDRPSIAEFGGPQRYALGEQLVRAREVALRHPTLADAEAAGFVPTTPYAPGTGAHRGDPANAQPPGRPLDVERPQSYLYDGTAPDSRVVGLMYVQLGGEEPPEGFIGPLDVWTPFRGQCLRPGTTDPVFPAAGSVTEQRCTEAGGDHLDVTAWTLHVWVSPGWEAPGGVFAPLNDDIVCADGTRDSDPVDGCPAPTFPGGTP